MTKYFIETPKGEWLSNIEDAGPCTTNSPFRAMGFDYWEDANEQKSWLVSERDPGERLGYSVTQHIIQEFENRWPERFTVGTITFGGAYTIHGITPRKHDIEVLRKGEYTC